MKSRFIKIILSLIFILLIGCVKHERSNFVFILVDDLGWKDLGCYGSEFYETPHIDQLASEGMLFSQAYAASPVCSPTRASIMTGKHPVRIGITDWIPGRNPPETELIAPEDIHRLPLGEVTIAEKLREAGYRTFYAGKWHLGDNGYYPENQGFEINKGGYEGGHPAGGYYTPYDNPKLADGPPGEYLTDRLTDESIQFLRQSQHHPFLLYLAYYTVHTPIQACLRNLDHFKHKAQRLHLNQSDSAFIQERHGWTRTVQADPAYASMIFALDENVGRLTGELKSLGMEKNTIVIFMSDNGGLSTLGKKSAPTANLPLRAGKGWCYEGGIRVPMIIKAPGITSPGSRCTFPVISHDFFPTMLQLAHLPLSPQLHRDGISLVPLLEDQKEPDRKALFWHYPHYHGSTWAPGAAVRAGDWKLITFYEEDKQELYYLPDDPGERKDLAGKEPVKKEELQKMLEEWQADLGAKLPVPRVQQ